MGDVLDPKPPQWQRTPALVDVKEDRIAQLAERLLAALNTELDSTVVQLAALRLLQKTVVGIYIQGMGVANARELLRQAAEMADSYTIIGVERQDGEPTVE